MVVSIRLHNRARKYMPHVQIMRGGVLMSLIGSFEVLLSDLLRLYYERHASALESDEKIHSFNEIRSFGSLNEFLSHVIENKIDGFLRGSLVEWVKFFQRLRIDLTRFAPSWADFAECFQRRHVIVHNGGRVSRQYLERVDSSWLEKHKEETKLGRFLEVSAEYLAKAFDSFELVGCLLSQECWKKFAHDDLKARGSTILEHQYECLVDARWKIAEGLGSWVISEGEFNALETLIVRINRWLSIKRQGRWSEIEPEITSFDYSILEHRFVAAIYSLTGDADSFFRILPKAAIPVDDLKAWPILEDMRQDPRFGPFIEDLETSANMKTST